MYFITTVSISSRQGPMAMHTRILSRKLDGHGKPLTSYHTPGGLRLPFSSSRLSSHPQRR